MTIIDRYLLFAFFKILLISFISFAGLFVVIHVFTNLDEVGEILDQDNGLEILILDFYGPQLLDLFSRMTGVLILISAIFSITLMQRRREMTAIEAAGITKARIVRPVIFASIFVVTFAVVSREVWIPPIKHKLARTLKNWSDDDVVAMTFFKDVNSGLLVSGKEIDLKKLEIEKPTVQLPVQLAAEVSKIEANSGTILEATEQHPRGILLSEIQIPERPRNMPSVNIGEQTLVYSSRDYRWLKNREAFIAVDVDVEEVAFGGLASRYGSILELIETTQRPNRRFVVRDRVEIHSRIIQPFLDILLLLLGLPLVISKSRDNIFLAAAICMVIVAAVQLTTVAGQTMGAYRIVQPTALAAWLPILLFAPMTAFSLSRLYK